MKRRSLFTTIAAWSALSALAMFLSCTVSRGPCGTGNDASVAKGSVAIDQNQIARGGIIIQRILTNTVPNSAVVWFEGKAWIYIENERNHFVRREVLIAGSLQQNREFALHAKDKGDLVVVVGAQLLLSEEFRLQIESGME